ncbi:MBOAT family protein [Rhodospirillaceae bacterium KN72]|uniref:Probable alginate O-acetylase AlgI n=1 Tax=Pacificispira spongiicola TaxID=2729598 RepID=A0A7Y0HFA8_9PROT|nr:MBOAT family O-acyltransferase [Pacificispira spongiicola]NMM43044.1 MBOAT family protein [Pacificispira spongiicola]
MLFSSREFLFVFLPIALLLYHGARHLAGGKAALLILSVTSLFFYGWWNPPYLLLLLGSIAGNLLLARAIKKKGSGWLLTVGVAANLAVIGYFKYRNFFIENIGYLVGESWDLGPIFVPLAISFFTFQQIAFLCDVADGKADPKDGLGFVTFVALFPQLIAGPIVLYREMTLQFDAVEKGEGKGCTLVAAGLVVFVLGLFKKVVLADSIGPYADAAFVSVDTLTFLEAWAAALAYSFQLYFDFSGYSDMAVGLGLMLGFSLPINFDTPFRAVSMIDFWKRWHITMTRFFMMYLFSPIALALTRFSMERRLAATGEFVLAVALPIIVTFLLSGLWHGAAWTYVAFGGVNAVGLVANHAWKKGKLPRLPRLLGWVLTMLTVVVSFVFFRAETLADAGHLLALMANPATIVMPNWLSGIADTVGLPWHTLRFFATGSYTIRLAAWLAVLLPLSLLIPNLSKNALSLRFGWGTAFAIAGMAWLSLSLLDRPQAFIYFQF